MLSSVLLSATVEPIVFDDASRSFSICKASLCIFQLLWQNE
jgi:hypothetical protein